MKKVLQVIGSTVGVCWICFWAKSLDTFIGCLCFALGIILFVGSWISIIKDTKKDKEEK